MGGGPRMIRSVDSLDEVFQVVDKNEAFFFG